MSSNPVSLGAGVKTGRPIDTIAVQKCHRRHLQFSCTLNERLRLRGTLKEAEGAGGMQLDIPISHRAPPFASRRVSGHVPGDSRATRYFAREPRGPIVRDPRGWVPTNRHMLAKARKHAR